jgi:hypothetical protein
MRSHKDNNFILKDKGQVKSESNQLRALCIISLLFSRCSPHLEEAAIAGHPEARHNLGCEELDYIRFEELRNIS